MFTPADLSPVASPFGYKNGHLNCEDVALSAISQSVGTPVYVYSRAELESRAQQFVDQTALASDRSLVCYAVKANGNPTLLKLIAELELGADVTSGGELFLAQQSGMRSERIVFSGVGKTRREIAEAISMGILALHVESEMELLAVAEEAERLGVVARVGVRVNPNIDAKTHPYISTGLAEHKFGVSTDIARAMILYADQHRWLQPVSLAIHIGSQVTNASLIGEAAQGLVELADEISGQGVALDYIDVGGGLGIDYREPAPTIADWIGAIAPVVRGTDYRLVIEPGRSIIGSAAVLLTRVLYTKRVGSKQFVIVDAGMTDLIRPALYQAYHEILPVVERQGPEMVMDVVGPVCETSDFLARDRTLPPLTAGDLLAVSHAGAYGFAMSSNYNGRLRPAEVLVAGDEYEVIRRRETYEDLLART